MSEQLTLTTLEWEGERGPLAKAFVAAQKATESVKKAATNPAFKSKYADLAHVVEGVIPALNGAGVGVLQFPAFDGELVSVTTTLLHESGASVSATLHLRPTKNDPQGVGSAITYARRYSLLAITGSAPEDDDGNAASRPAPPQARRTEPQAPTLTDRADRLEATMRAVGSVSELDKAFKLASGLCAELSDKDPARLAKIEALRVDLENGFAQELAA